MADRSDGGDSVSETEIREIVREELQEGAKTPTSRRRLLGALGVAGIAGLAGCSSNDESSTDLRITDNGSKVRRGVRTLNFRRNLTIDMDGDQVTVDAEHGIDIVGNDGENTSISSIDIGPGLNASIDDGSLSISRSENQFGDGMYLARPDDVQSTLDDAFVDGIGRVNLVSGATYEFADSIEVPPGVALDGTGALIDLQADVNVFELHTQSQIFSPNVRTSNVDGYSSSIFHIYPKQFGEPFGTNRPVPLWTVYGGWSEMTPGEGTCIELHGARENPSGEYRARKHSRNVYFCLISHNCIGGRRFAYLHREGGNTTRGGHVNGNIIKGFARDTTRFVETNDSTGSGKNMVNGNKFYLLTQPGSNSEWLWYANKGSLNELYEWGHNWDFARYSDADDDGYGESWYIGPNAGMNFLWRKRNAASGGLGSTVLDDSDGASGSKYLTLEQLGTSVDELEVWDNAK